MIEHTYVNRITWGNRIISYESFSLKSFKTIQCLAELDEHYSRWYPLGLSRGSSIVNGPITDYNSMTDYILEKHSNEKLMTCGYLENGFLCSLWTGHKDEHASKITFAAGSNSLPLGVSNRVILKLPFSGVEKERLINLSKSHEILSRLIKIWQPEKGELLRNSVFDLSNSTVLASYNKDDDSIMVN